MQMPHNGRLHATLKPQIRCRSSLQKGKFLYGLKYLFDSISVFIVSVHVKHIRAGSRVVAASYTLLQTSVIVPS